MKEREGGVEGEGGKWNLKTLFYKGLYFRFSQNLTANFC